MSSLVAQMVKRLPAMQETRVRSLGWEDTLEKEMATHSSIHAWRIPWTEEPGGLQFMGHKELDTTEQPSFHFLKVYFSKKEADTEEDMPKLIPLGGINEVTNGKLTR